MKIVKEKVIPGTFDLNDEELYIVINFKVLLGNISEYMTIHNIDIADTVTRKRVEDLLHDVQAFYNDVGVDYSTDDIVIRRADNGQAT